MAPSNLSRRFLLALALLQAVATSSAVAATTTDTCGYIFKSTDPRTYVAFNESTVLRAFSPKGSVRAEPGLTIKLWYNDEHALTLGVRRVVVKTRTGTTTTDYPFTTLATNPASALYPQVGATALDGDQAGTDTAYCSGYPDRCDRPMFPALFLTDTTSTPSSKAGDWQSGGKPIPPHAVFGTWKGAVRYVDKTRSPAAITVTNDVDPAKNNWNLGSGDPAPAGLSTQGYGAEIRWNVDDLVVAGKMIPGHTYRLQFMVHDGDQNTTGGDSGEGCVNVQPYCTTATDCNDRNACTADSCSAGVCSYTPIAGCKLCTTAADCNDGNVCTTDACNAGACQNTAIAGCTPCTTAADCNDGNACTTDACNAGACQNTAIAGCTPCTTDADCNDGNACTTDSCNAGVCQTTAIVGCKLCTTAADCDDQNACTTDSCSAGVCQNTAIAGCKLCAADTDCDDQNVCTYDTCNAGVCSNTAIDPCKPCTTAADCDDQNLCTIDTCGGGMCSNTSLEGCKPCTTAADCDDQNACTTDSCSSGVCRNATISGCCTTVSDCNDNNACTTDTCSDSVCVHTPISGCACTFQFQCDDNNTCTTDTCTNRACVHTPISGCTQPESAPAEICGNCIDDDGNGLTDFEDPACCLQSDTFAMTLKGGRLRPHGSATRLALRSVLARSGLVVNPLAEDVFLQIRPEGGTDVFCARIPAANFTKHHRAFEFADRKHSVASAGRLDGMKIKVMRDGSVRLRTHGKRAQMIHPSAGRLQVTVGFHSAAAGDGASRCSTTLRTFRAGRNGRLITP